ncbi:uncharacterized protein BX663DRAFT_524077 [Cokeromyces recurvatus]|uniref:uncharacterized protein n=1 Tax=Cokeromyces recurvatus TaxID=90255 RepID=UPI00221F929D|nr:uncharacterized protein BX663DRAFT_524077 [Cokeromyces recurvatus]KAI7898608.1 hypothetical protein BX663DRAFT_524077 [Cokeromyces recurvatus]
MRKYQSLHHLHYHEKKRGILIIPKILIFFIFACLYILIFIVYIRIHKDILVYFISLIFFLILHTID